MNGSEELRSTDSTGAGGDNGRGAGTSDNRSGDDAAYHRPGCHKRDQNDVSRQEAGDARAARASGTGNDDVSL